MATYNIHGGHSLKCRGASGLLDEVNEDRKVKNKVIELLRAKGHTVYDCTDDGGTTPIKNLKNIVSKCNAHNVDLDVSIHLNAGGGHGCEVYGYSNNISGVGARVSANIASALGITNRGFKVRTNLYVLHRTNSPAILIECCFVDSREDHDKWSVDKCAHAIADAIIGNRAAAAPIPKPNIQPKPQPKHVNHVDGVWGEATTKALQRYLGTVVDGIISHQLVSSEKLLISRFGHTFRFDDTRKGSLCIKALQKKLGVTADGLIGKNTIKALQKWLGVTVDGVCGKNTTIALQKFLDSKGMF